MTAQATWRCKVVASLGLENVGGAKHPTDHTAISAVFKRHPEKDAPEKDGKVKKKNTQPRRTKKKQKQLSDKNPDTGRAKELTAANTNSEEVGKNSPKK